MWLAVDTLLIVGFCHCCSEFRWAGAPVCFTFNRTQLELIFHECRFIIIFLPKFNLWPTYTRETFHVGINKSISFLANSYWHGMIWRGRFWHGIFWRTCSCCFYDVMPCHDQSSAWHNTPLPAWLSGHGTIIVVGVQGTPGTLIFSEKISYNFFGYGKQELQLARI